MKVISKEQSEINLKSIIKMYTEEHSMKDINDLLLTIIMDTGHIRKDLWLVSLITTEKSEDTLTNNYLALVEKDES